jgi:hypothetical protein
MKGCGQFDEIDREKGCHVLNKRFSSDRCNESLYVGVKVNIEQEVVLLKIRIRIRNREPVKRKSEYW